MTRTHYTLQDVGGALPWSSLASFIKYLGGDSALAKDLDKSTGWDETIRTNAILADIYDLLQVLNYNLVQFATQGKKKPKTKPYPRPGRDNDNTHKIGRDALPVDELHEWIRKRQEHGER